MQTSGPVVLKVVGISPLGVILRSKRANKTKWTIGGQNNKKGAKTLNYSSVPYYYDVLLS